MDDSFLFSNLSVNAMVPPPLETALDGGVCRLCELQRICYGETSGAPRTIAVEDSLAASRQADKQEIYLNLLFDADPAPDLTKT